MDEPELVFEEPPERPPVYPWERIAQRLRENPMQWAVVFREDRASVVTAVKQGSVKAVHPDLGFEARTSANRRTPEGRRVCTMHLRYNPDKENNASSSER